MGEFLVEGDAPGSGGLGHQPHERLLVGFLLGQAAGDGSLTDRVDAVRETQQLRELGRDDNDTLPLLGQALDDPVDLAPAEADALEHERFHHPHPHVRRKMEALWLKSQG